MTHSELSKLPSQSAIPSLAAFPLHHLDKEDKLLFLYLLMTLLITELPCSRGSEAKSRFSMTTLNLAWEEGVVTCPPKPRYSQK
jgi:hypothetical protein